LAKFKKKKSAPTPGSDDSKPKIADGIDVPEVEKSEPLTNNSKDPSKDPPISDAAKSEKDKKLAKLFWMRIALGVIAGIATTFIFEDIEGEERRWASIGGIYDNSIFRFNYCCQSNENAITIIR